MASKELQTAIAMFKQLGESLGATPAESRRAYEELVAGFKLAPDIKVEPVSAGGITAEWITAPGASRDPRFSTCTGVAT